MTFSKKGFTLFEMMIVIALIGLFFVAASYLTHDARIWQTNTERLANKIYDIIRNTRNDMTIGRWVLTDWVLVAIKQRDISISNAGISITYTDSHDATGSDNILPAPFFDNDSNYKIVDISVSSGWLSSSGMYTWDHTGSTSANIIVGTSSSLAIAADWVDPTFPIRTIKITAGYTNFTRSVILDRASGTVEIRTSSDD
mgnify:FL=1